MGDRPTPARTLEAERNARLARECAWDVPLGVDPQVVTLEAMAARTHAGILAFLGANRERVRAAMNRPRPEGAFPEGGEVE